jgi:hypothetical protein
MLAMMKRLDLFRHPSHALTLTRVAMVAEYDDHDVFRFLEAFRVAQKVNFNALSEEQRMTLKGTEVGKAIDVARLEVIKQIK